MGKTKHFTKHVFKNETLDVRKVKKKNNIFAFSLCLVMFLCICFIIILVSSPTFEREKKKIIWILGTQRRMSKPRGKIQARSPCPSVGCLPGKHLHKLLAFKTRQPVPMYFRLAGQAGIETLFVFYFFPSLFRAIAHNLSGINDVVNKIRQVCGWICLAGLVPVLLRDKPTAGLIYLPQPHPAVPSTGHTTRQLIIG